MMSRGAAAGNVRHDGGAAMHLGDCPQVDREGELHLLALRKPSDAVRINTPLALRLMARHSRRLPAGIMIYTWCAPDGVCAGVVP
jgi:hypothetical protein